MRSAADRAESAVRPGPGPSQERNRNPEDTAWRIYSILVDWIGKFDTKASFALTIESAVLVAITALSGGGRRLGKIDGFALWVFYFGVAALAVGAILAISVVSPLWRRGKVRAESHDNFVFYGHIRHWDPADLATALRERDALPMLTRQLVTLSDIAWSKHERVKGSFAFAVLGALMVALAGVFG